VDIKFFNESHEIIKIASRFISSNWQIKFCDYGDYLGVFGKNDALFKKLKNEDFVYMEQDGKQSIITGIEYYNSLKVYGRSLNYIMEKMKPIQPQTFTNANIEVIARSIATQAFSNVTDFELGSLKTISLVLTYSITDLKIPSEVLKELLAQHNLGYRVYVQNKKWKFEVLTNQEKNIVLSEGMKNVTNITYSENVNNYACSSIIKNVDNTYSEISNVPKTGIKKWYNLSKNIDELKVAIKEKNIELETRKIKYNKDYILGDILRVKKDSEEYKKIVTEVIFWYENNNIGEQPKLSEVQA
jgi:hypothetical protein